MSITRIPPAMPSSSYVTYRIKQRSDIAVVAACQDVGCEAWHNGWETTVDESTPLGQAQARYIRTESGRTFRELKIGPLTVFRFDSKQRCFAEHRTRPELYARINGDHRQSLGSGFAHANARDWVEDFTEHQTMIAEAIEKG